MKEGITISLDKLMLRKSADFRTWWKEDKQQSWGMLTAITIQLAAKKLETGAISSHEALSNFIAGFRETIGAILNHEPDYGIVREQDACSVILDHPKNRNCDQIAEFHAMVEDLKNAQLINQYGILKNEQEANIHNRSRICKVRMGYQINHTKITDIKARLAPSDIAFKAFINNPNRTHLNQVLFYAADAMPYQLGSSAIEEMKYHALEKAFLGAYSYFAKAKSKYNNDRGVDYDLAAMLSADFDSFESYFMNNILDQDIIVEELSEPNLLGDIKPLNKQELVAALTALEEDLADYKNNLIRDSINWERRPRVEQLIKALQFLKCTLDSLDETDKTSMASIQTCMHIYLEFITKDLLIYHSFSASGAKRSSYWKQPSISYEVGEQLEQQRADILRAFHLSIEVLSRFSEKMAYLLHIEGSEDELKFPYLTMRGITTQMDVHAQEFKEPLHVMQAHLQHIIGNNQEVFTEGSIAFFDFITELKKRKNAGLDLNAYYKERLDFYTSEEYAKGNEISQRFKIEMINDTFPQMGYGLNQLQANMAKSYVLWKAICPQMPPLEALFPPREYYTGYRLPDFCYNYVASPVISQFYNCTDSLAYKMSLFYEGRQALTYLYQLKERGLSCFRGQTQEVQEKESNSFEKLKMT